MDYASKQFVRLGVLAACGLALMGCQSIREAAGLGKQSPDEFAVVTKAPLIIPPDFNLRPPRDGAPPTNQVQPTDAAQSALFDDPAAAAKRMSGDYSEAERHAARQRARHQSRSRRSVSASPPTAGRWKPPTTASPARCCSGRTAARIAARNVDADAESRAHRSPEGGRRRRRHEARGPEAGRFRHHRHQGREAGIQGRLARWDFLEPRSQSRSLLFSLPPQRIHRAQGPQAFQFALAERHAGGRHPRSPRAGRHPDDLVQGRRGRRSAGAFGPRAFLRAHDVPRHQDRRRATSSRARSRAMAARTTRSPRTTTPPSTNRSPRTGCRSSMSLEADRMANLDLSDTNVTTERDVVLEERRMRIDNDPQALLARADRSGAASLPPLWTARDRLAGRSPSHRPRGGAGFLRSPLRAQQRDPDHRGRCHRR